MMQNLKNAFLRLAVSKTSREVKHRGLSYLSWQKMRNLEKCIQKVEQTNVPGLFLEAGVALGGSAMVIASLMSKGRAFRGYDVFEMIPSPSDRDDEDSKARYEKIKGGQAKGIKGAVYYGYMENLYEGVIKNFSNCGLAVDSKRISLHKGLFEQTLHFEKNEAVALAHLDCDWYDPVKLCLERIYPVLSPGGIIIIDDYFRYGGCKKATDEFINLHPDLKTIVSSEHLIFQRIK
jgi:O-methyltransferase